MVNDLPSSSPAPLTALAEPRMGEFLRAERCAHLATADRSGVPHNVPLCFWFEGTAFYFVIDEKPKRAGWRELKRMRNIAANPRVALVIDHYEEDWGGLAFVLVHGRARIVEDGHEYMAALRGLRDKYAQYRTMEMSPDANPIVRIDPRRVHVWGARFKGIGA